MINPFENIDVPETVYKYRDWNNNFHKKVITRRELFLASPALFNDPFDCKLPIAYWKLGVDTQLAREYFPQMVERHKPHLSKGEKEKEVARLIDEGRFKDMEYLEVMEKNFFEELNSKIGLVSLTAYRDNILMWSHYSNSHKGFCIGFKSKILFNNPDHFGRGGQVIYKKEFPIILPTEDFGQQIVKQTYIKSDIWAYEKEYRLSKFNGANKTIVFPEDSVSEIILGCSISDSDRNAIINVSKCNFPKANIIQVREIKNTFKIGFEQIE
jgi:hypothetical protein